MNTKGKIDFTKTDNIQFIEEVASEISKEDKNWQSEARLTAAQRSALIR